MLVLAMFRDQRCVPLMEGATVNKPAIDAPDTKQSSDFFVSSPKINLPKGGNAIRYEYKPENLQRVNRASANEANRSDDVISTNRYIKRIKYGNKTPRQNGEVLSARNDWMFEVVFDYGEHSDENSHGAVQILDYDGQREWNLRQDPFSSHRARFEVRTYRLCQRVLMFHHFADLLIANYLVRATPFQYQPNVVLTKLTAVTQSGYERINNVINKDPYHPSRLITALHRFRN